jgi:hypothetical protein
MDVWGSVGVSMLYNLQTLLPACLRVVPMYGNSTCATQCTLGVHWAACYCYSPCR